MASEQPPDPPARRAGRDALLALAILAPVFAGGAAVSWRKWGDIMVDYGVQLYAPWRLSQGAVLYRDVPYLTGGPLSQYFDAALFKIFGVSVLTLVIANLVLIAALTALIYRCFYKAADQLTAVLAALAVLTVFAFAHYQEFGIFNYVSPYSQEIFHGLALAVASIALLSRWLVERKARQAAAAGFCVGLAFLTKAEVSLAALVALGVGLWLRRRMEPHDDRRGLALMALSALAPPLAFLVFFWPQMGLAGAARSVCWAWTPLLTTSAAVHNPLYVWCMGLNAPWRNVERMLLHSIVLTAVVAAFALLSSRTANIWWRRAFVLGGIALVDVAISVSWGDCGRCLPALCLVALGMLLWRIGRRGVDGAAVFPLLWTVFSLVLLAKLGVYPRIWYYGFVLAMPAFLAGIFLLVWLLPGNLAERGLSMGWFRALAAVALAAGFVQLSRDSLAVYAHKTKWVGSGADRLLTFEPSYGFVTGAAMGVALEWLEAKTPANATIAVLPEGPMLNYMARRVNPTHYLRWNPTEMAVFGQQNMTDAFEANPPDYIAILGVSGSMFGIGYFGDEASNFGFHVMQWIDQNYHAIGQIGPDWRKTNRFGIRIYERNALLDKRAPAGVGNP